MPWKLIIHAVDVAHTTAAKHDLSRTLTLLIRAVVLDDRPVKAVGLQQRLKYLVHAEIVCVTGVLIVRVDRSELHPQLAILN
jgi:hypothetical protein